MTSERSQAARRFYDYLVANVGKERMTPPRRQFGEDFRVIEHECEGVVRGKFMGSPSNGRRIVFPMLHPWDFKDDAIGREQVWLDGGSIVARSTAA